MTSADVVAALRRWCAAEREHLASTGVTVEYVDAVGDSNAAFADFGSLDGTVKRRPN
jgi:hypothetical protein